MRLTTEQIRRLEDIAHWKSCGDVGPTVKALLQAVREMAPQILEPEPQPVTVHMADLLGWMSEFIQAANARMATEADMMRDMKALLDKFPGGAV